MHVVAQDACSAAIPAMRSNVRGTLAQGRLRQGADRPQRRRAAEDRRPAWRPPATRRCGPTMRRTTAMTMPSSRQSATSCARPPAHVAGGASGISAAMPASSPASPPSTPIMSSPWTATGWRSSAFIQAQQGAARPRQDPAAGGQPRPTRRRTRAGAALERKSLPERGKPELTLCLALIHHIVIGANIPMRDFIGWLAGLGTVARHRVRRPRRRDGRRRCCANKDDQYDDYRPEIFESAARAAFRHSQERTAKGRQARRSISRCQRISGHWRKCCRTASALQHISPSSR